MIDNFDPSVTRAGSPDSVLPAIEAETVRGFLGSVADFSVAAGKALDDEPLCQVFRGRLTRSQLRILEHVAVAEGHTIGDVAAVLGVSNPAASKAVDKLVRRHLLHRSDAKSDRRASALTLTETGRRLLAALEDARRRRIEEIFLPISTDDLRRAAELLRRLAANITSNNNVELQPR